MLSLLRMFRDCGKQVVFASPAQHSEYMVDLVAEGIQTADILLNDSSFDSFVAQLQPDYVVYDRFMMEEQFSWRVEQASPQSMHILDTEDLQCLRRARQHAQQRKRSFVKQDLFNDVALRECAAILRSDLSLIISDYEMQLLQHRFRIDKDLLHYLPFMLNPDHPQRSDISFSQRQDFVTIGNFRHAPNWDSVRYLQQIWPLIRQQLPDARLHIYGAYPPKKAMALNNPESGFLVEGWAADAHEVLGMARVCLSPLRFGAGIKGKLVDAMLAGTPSVTTSIGAEGINGKYPWPGEIVNDMKSIAQAAVTLYSNEHLWQQSRLRIQPILQNRFHGTSLAKAVMQRIELIRNDLPQHRLNNFTGSMLRHHSMKSTLYMSKWIEAKNKLRDFPTM